MRVAGGIDEFQYPLVDWGDGDLNESGFVAQDVKFQYPLVDWGDGDLFCS